MTWKECAGVMETYSPGWRLHWPERGWNEFDCEEAFTVSDVWGAISWIWTWPGDWIFSQEPIRTFFEIEGTTAIGAMGSTILGWVIFWVLLSGFFAEKNV